MGRDKKRGKSNKGWKSPAQSGSNKKKRRQGGWNDDLELEFQFYNNGVKPAKENKPNRRHSLPASLNEKPSAFRKFKGSPVASLRNPTPVHLKKPSPVPRRNNTYAYDYSNNTVDEDVHTLQNDEVDALTRAYVKMAVNQIDESSSSDTSALSGSDSSDDSEVELNSDGEYDYNDLLNEEDSSGEGGHSDEFDDLDSDDDEHESDDDEGEDMDTDEEEAEQEAVENEDQQEEEIEGNPTFFIDKTADITILQSLELSQSRDDVLQTPEIVKSNSKIKRPKSTSDKIKIAKNKKQPIVVYAPSDSKKKNRVTAKVMRNIGELEKWFSDGNSSEEDEDSDEIFDKEAVLDYLQNVSPTHRENFLNSKSFDMHEDYSSPDENITRSQLNVSRRISERVDRQDKKGKIKKGKTEQRPRRDSPKHLRGPRGEKGFKKKGNLAKYTKPVSWVQGQSLQDTVEEEYKEFAEVVATLHNDNNNNATNVVVDVDIIVDNVQRTPQGKKKDKKEGKKKGQKPGFDAKKLNNINENITVLVDTDSLKELPMEPMNRTQRLQVLKLAACYNVKGISRGSGKRKYLVLVKTPHTYYCDEVTVKQTIREALAINSDTNKRAKGEKFIPTQRAPLQKGRIVAEHASPIDDNNLGNRLLRGMGWSGGGLGANGQGIEAPVVATIKHDKRGLGF